MYGTVDTWISSFSPVSTSWWYQKSHDQIEGIAGFSCHTGPMERLKHRKIPRAAMLTKNVTRPPQFQLGS